MISRVCPHLDFKEIFGVADVLFQISGHFTEGLKQIREYAQIGLKNRVFFVHHIETDIPIIGVDGDLDRVSDVIDALVVETPRRAAGVGEHIRCRVGVQYPEQPPPGNHQLSQML